MTSNVVSGVAEVDAENAEHIVLEVARDISKLELANETMDDVETAFLKTSSDYMRDAGLVIYYFIFNFYSLCLHFDVLI